MYPANDSELVWYHCQIPKPDRQRFKVERVDGVYNLINKITGKHYELLTTPSVSYLLATLKRIKESEEEENDEV